MLWCETETKALAEWGSKWIYKITNISNS